MHAAFLRGRAFYKSMWNANGRTASLSLPYLKVLERKGAYYMSSSWPDTWDAFKALPCVVVSLTRKPERWAQAEPLIRARGFEKATRWDAVDAAQEDALAAADARHGTLPKDPSDGEFHAFKGKQGCLYSHLDIWKHAIESNDPAWDAFVVFEDDVVFHPQFDTLAPTYYASTPKSKTNLVYLGAQLDAPSAFHVDRVPVFCTHAYAMTRDGARKAYEFVTKHPRGLYTIDCMLIDAYKAHCSPSRKPTPLEWVVWNGTFYPTPTALMDKGWTKRNGGLVFQDEAFGSDVRPW